MLNDGFASSLSRSDAETLGARCLTARGAVLTATTLAASGHPGGSMSCMEIYQVLYGCARLRADEPRWAERDRIVVSHGHTSPGVYTALASAGFFPLNEVKAHFRQAGSIFEGHVERSVPGVEWSTGNLGQGLSAGVGMALASRLTGIGWHTYVAMSDGEQHKGQVAEARRLAVKERLADLTVVVDLNGIQISGATADIMPVDVAADFAADGWHVVHMDGHDVVALHEQLRSARSDSDRPWALIAHTVIGKGVSFMEGKADFHGRGLTPEEYARAMAELGLDEDLDAAKMARGTPCTVCETPVREPGPPPAIPAARTYAHDKQTDNRSAWGAALVDISSANPELPIAVLDCDLAVSVKTDGFRAARPEGFVQCGVGEHNAATAAGAVSASGVLTFYADFGVFGCDEVYNQQRLNDINGASVKLALTHCGLDVGEDGKTHQCLDYAGAFRNLFGWRVIVPADPNQTDRAVRAAAAMEGNVAIAMGRSKLPVILHLDGQPAFAGDYAYDYGRVDWVREGDDACLLAMGTVAGSAVQVSDTLGGDGVRLAVGIVSTPLTLADADMVRACSSGVLLTVEDHAIATGLAASVCEWMALNGSAARLTRIGVTGYHSSGRSADVLAEAGLDEESIAATVRAALGSAMRPSG